MNESGSAAGPARGELRAPLDHVVVLHDEIDLEFGTVRVRLGGGLAGHNGLKSLRRGLGGADFWRVRAGVGRPDSSDPEVVSAYVLSRFTEHPEEVEALIADAAGEAEILLAQIAAGDARGAAPTGIEEAEGG
jgi:peptidyl-tRNA hydrolase, PTH1 family